MNWVREWCCLSDFGCQADKISGPTVVICGLGRAPVGPGAKARLIPSYNNTFPSVPSSPAILKTVWGIYLGMAGYVCVCVCECVVVF